MAEIIQSCFKRYEKKYFITEEQQKALLEYITPYMKKDKYEKYTINNIYYDTDDYRLIRESVEKPVYKEKLRVRSYGVVNPEENVFIEIKKKYKGVVYKRRITEKASLSEPFLYNLIPNRHGQIGKELIWFQKIHQSCPKVFIGYDRAAFAGIENPELRLTFDTNMHYRTENLSLTYDNSGEPILNTDKILMEIKIPGTSPLWLSHMLDELKIYPSSFSKYGTVYREHILKDIFKVPKSPVTISAAPYNTCAGRKTA